MGVICARLAMTLDVPHLENPAITKSRMGPEMEEAESLVDDGSTLKLSASFLCRTVVCGDFGLIILFRRVGDTHVSIRSSVAQHNF